MFCPRCGAGNPDGESYCLKCEAPLEMSPSDLAVPEAENAPASKTLATLGKPPSEAEKEALHLYLATPINDFPWRPPSRQNAGGVKGRVTNFFGENVGSVAETCAEYFLDRLARSPGDAQWTTNNEADKPALQREALYQQGEILRLAAQYLNKSPWVTYLCARKCRPFLDHFEITGASLTTSSEKRFLEDLLHRAHSLEDSALHNLSGETKTSLFEMIRLTEKRSVIDSALRAVNHVIKSKDRKQIVSALLGQPMPVEKRPVVLPNGSLLRLAGIFLSLGTVAAFIFLLVSQKAKLGSEGKLLALALGIGGILLGIVLFRVGTHRQTERHHLELAEQTRTADIAREISEACAKFRQPVSDLLGEIEMAYVDAIVSLEETRRKLELLLRRADELITSYTRC